MRKLLIAVAYWLATAQAFGHSRLDRREECAKEAALSDAGITKVKAFSMRPTKEAQGQMLKNRKEFRKKLFVRIDELVATLKETEAEKADTFGTCLKNTLKPHHERCASTAGISEAGLAKIHEAFKHEPLSRGSETPNKADFIKHMKEIKDRYAKMIEDAKKALEETDKDKVEAWDTCMKNTRGHFHRGLGHKNDKKDDAVEPTAAE